MAPPLAPPRAGVGALAERRGTALGPRPVVWAASPASGPGGELSVEQVSGAGKGGQWEAVHPDCEPDADPRVRDEADPRPLGHGRGRDAELRVPGAAGRGCGGRRRDLGAGPGRGAPLARPAAARRSPAGCRVSRTRRRQTRSGAAARGTPVRATCPSSFLDVTGPGSRGRPAAEAPRGRDSARGPGRGGHGNPRGPGADACEALLSPHFAAGPPLPPPPSE
uniref:Uncharacterized protein n=1 Tax=Myotis myotis TaxID=51298 RepID=A0A7J7T5T8_MYOMY|nr:hypothetical protein mMyoMyo1_009164 [Myotis myotis]